MNYVSGEPPPTRGDDDFWHWSNGHDAGVRLGLAEGIRIERERWLTALEQGVRREPDGTLHYVYAEPKARDGIGHAIIFPDGRP